LSFNVGDIVKINSPTNGKHGHSGKIVSIDSDSIYPFEVGFIGGAFVRYSQKELNLVLRHDSSVYIDSHGGYDIFFDPSSGRFVAVKDFVEAVSSRDYLALKEMLGSAISPGDTVRVSGPEEVVATVEEVLGDGSIMVVAAWQVDKDEWSSE